VLSRTGTVNGKTIRKWKNQLKSQGNSASGLAAERDQFAHRHTRVVSSAGGKTATELKTPSMWVKNAHESRLVGSVVPLVVLDVLGILGRLPLHLRAHSVPLRAATNSECVNCAAARTNSKLNGMTSKFGWLQAPATKISFLSIISVNPATIRICMPQWRFGKVATKALPISHDGYDMIDSFRLSRHPPPMNHTAAGEQGLIGSARSDGPL
jgi:hypothetical protein